MSFSISFFFGSGLRSPFRLAWKKAHLAGGNLLGKIVCMKGFRMETVLQSDISWFFQGEEM